MAVGVSIAEGGPQIFETNPIRGKNSARIRWSTNIEATSQVDYGTDKNLGLSVLDNTLVTDHNIKITNLTPNAQYYYQIKSTDENGKSSVSEILTFWTDVTQPTLNVISPLDKATVSGTTTISVKATDNIGISKMDFFLDGKKKGSDSETPYEILWDTSGCKDGKHVLFICAVDVAGNFDMKQINVTVKNLPDDTTAPTVTITSPQNGATVSGKVKIIAEATDDLSGIDEIKFFINGRKSGYCLSPPYEREWDTLLYTPGDYRLQVKATDFAGNVGKSEIITVTVSGDASKDRTPPVTINNNKNKENSSKVSPPKILLKGNSSHTIKPDEKYSLTWVIKGLKEGQKITHTDIHWAYIRDFKGPKEINDYKKYPHKGKEHTSNQDQYSDEICLDSNEVKLPAIIVVIHAVVDDKDIKLGPLPIRIIKKAAMKKQ
jgi:hypothetical protein